MKTTIIFVALAGLTAAASGIDLTHLKTVDISAFNTSAAAPNWIGSNPSAIAWNGTDLFVGGYNSSGTPALTAMNRVSNLGNAHSLGATSFGGISTPNSRGMTGLAVRGNSLAAGLDTGAGSGDSARLFDATSNALTWRVGTAGADSTRRASGGVAFDPGFNGAGPNQGVTYLAPGSGRRHLLNETTGAYVNGQNAGAIINFSPAQTTWRDHAFDPATGDLYTRESNRVGKAVRNGDNSYSTVSGGQSVVLYSTTVASGVDNQNLAFVNSPNQGTFLIFNDRSAGSSGQTFGGVIKITDLSGAVQALNFLNAFTPATGNGAYDFSYNAATNTLAVSDFANRVVYLFGVPTPGAAGVLALGGLLATRRRRA